MKKIGVLGFVVAMIMILGMNVSDSEQQAKAVSNDIVVQFSEHGTGW